MKKIHQIWLQGESNLPEKYKIYSDKYKELNPTWEYKLWDLASIEDLIKNRYIQLLKIWKEYPFWVMRVDLGKYCILDSEGGLLIDMDTEPIKSFDNFLPVNTAMVLEHTNTFWHRLIGVKRTTNNNFIYIPYPNNSLSKKLVSTACCTSERLFFEFKFYYILSSIGPLFLINCINEIPKEDVLWVSNNLAKEYFHDEAANSWNKSLFDNSHDRKWGFLLLILVFLVLIALRNIWIRKS